MPNAPCLRAHGNHSGEGTSTWLLGAHTSVSLLPVNLPSACCPPCLCPPGRQSRVVFSVQRSAITTRMPLLFSPLLFLAASVHPLHPLCSPHRHSPPRFVGILRPSLRQPLDYQTASPLRKPTLCS